MPAAPVVRDFLHEALDDLPPIPFRAPPGIKLVRVNHKTGLPAGSRRQDAIMEAFKPSQEPLGAVARTPRVGEGLCRRTSMAEPAPQAAIPGAIPGQAPGPPAQPPATTGL